MKHFFIINPAAGKISVVNCHKGIEKACRKHGIEFEVAVSECKGDVERIAKDAAIRGFNRIYAIGGDGTLNEAANAIIGHIKAHNDSDIALVPVAAGTGNDFVRSLSNPSVYSRFASGAKKQDASKKEKDGSAWEPYISAVISGKRRVIDCAAVNDRYFINIASVGMDACVVRNALRYKQSKFCPDALSYIASVFSTFINYEPFDFTVSIDGEPPVRGEYTLIAVANGKYYGGGVMPVPHAELCNNGLDVCIAGKIKKSQVLNFFPKYAKGKHQNIPIVDFKHCREITITSPVNVFVNADGELFETDTANFKLMDFKLPVIELS